MVVSYIKYIFVLVVFGALWFGFRGKAATFLFVIMLILPAVSIFISKKIADKMKVECSFAKNSVGRGTKNTLRINVVNPTIFASAGVCVNLVLENTLYEDGKLIKIDIPVEGKGDNEVSIEMAAENSGYIVAKECTLWVKDFLGLYIWKIPKEVHSEYMVMPKNLFIDAEEVGYMPEDDADLTLSEVGEDTSQVESIREYIAGDRMQRIHWKLSQKMDDLMVKEYALDYNIDVNLVCELVKDEYHNNLDLLLDAFYSSMIMLKESNERFCVHFSNKNNSGIISLSIASMEDILDALAQLYYIKPYANTGLAVDYTKASGISVVMSVRWSTAADDANENVLQDFDKKVVLTWE